MLALLQRVREARVEVAGAVVGAIGPGLLMFVCAEPADTEATAARLVAKVLKLRIFADEVGKMNRSLADVFGGLLIVSQFTLAADTSGGNRPGFGGAAPPQQGRSLYEAVLQLARAQHAGPVEAGRFGAEMQVHLVNDGPVTIPLTIR
ncbi:MAG: D-tyrosyl-tRNA(Tyr) deacylase [Burkholderiales bacterium]|nr:D-tyrosyl-tRNA(Tyr) deacylase [Burkholderiales bacterium]